MQLFKYFPKTCLVVVISTLVLVVAIWAPLGRSEHWLYRFTKDENSTIALPPGQTAIQTVSIPSARISGLRFFIDSATPVKKLSVKLLNTQGQVVTQAYGYQYSYYNEHLAVTALIPWQTVGPKTHLKLVISHQSAKPIRLLAVTNPQYVGQKLVIEQQSQPNKTIPLELIEPTATNPGTQQGLLAGAFYLLAAVFALELFREQPRRQWLSLILIICLTTPLLLAGFWFSQGPLGINDWDYYFSLHTIWRNIVLTWHQFPGWNPYTCGGTAALGDPEFSMFTPTFLLELLFGIPTGVRLAIYLSTAVGAIGMLQWARRLGLSPWAGLLVTVIAFFGTVNLLEIVEGHVNIFAAMWIPWIFWAWVGAYRSQKWLSRSLIWCSLFLALTFYQGGIYLLLYTLITFILIPFIATRPWHAIKITLIAGVAALSLAAFKLVPVLLWLRQFPDKAYASAPYTIGSTIDIFFGRYLHGATLVPDQVAGWHEYGAYIGYFAFGLALVALSTLRRNKTILRLLIMAILFWILSVCGPLFVPIFDKAPFLPRSMVTRMIFYSVLPLSLLAGFGLDIIRTRWRQGSTLAIIVSCLVVFDIFSLTYQLSDQAFIVPFIYPSLPPLTQPINFIRQVHYTTLNNGERHISQYPTTLLGYGTLNYCSVLGPGDNITAIEDERPQDYIQTHPTATTAKVVNWTPNKVVVLVTVDTPTTVILNTNYAKGWQVNGQLAIEFENKVATKVTPGSHELSFSYHPPGLIVGAVITTLSFLLLIYLVVTRTNIIAKMTHKRMTTGKEKVAG